MAAVAEFALEDLEMQMAVFQSAHLTEGEQKLQMLLIELNASEQHISACRSRDLLSTLAQQRACIIESLHKSENQLKHDQQTYREMQRKRQEMIEAYNIPPAERISKPMPKTILPPPLNEEEPFLPEDDSLDSLKCEICFARARSTMCSPCSHVYSCLYCFEQSFLQLNRIKCAICKEHVREVIHYKWC